MSKAVTIHEVGGPEVLKFETVDVGDPGPGQALLTQTAAGLNFIDTYQRTGLYPLPSLPAVLGMEGAGVVEAVGVGVTEVAVGDRVAYSMAPGAYAERRLVPAAVLVRLPDGISDDQGAAMMLKGCTAQYLLRRTYRVEAGDTILIHAAAGGVGLIACQWAKHLGATVIGTVGSPDKAALAKAHGCDHAIDYTTENFVERVGEITHGAGVPVVYDSVGRDTFTASMGLPPAARAAGELRPILGGDPAFRSGGVGAKGVALPHAPYARQLHRHSRGARRDRHRAVRCGAERRGQDRGESDVPPRGGRHGPPRSRSAEDDRFHRASNATYCVGHRPESCTAHSRKAGAVLPRHQVAPTLPRKRAPLCKRVPPIRP